MTLKNRAANQKTIINRIDRMPIRKLRHSWWTAFAQPEQREQFAAAAHAHVSAREKEFMTSYEKPS